jgi:hypothetical protein
MIVLAEVGAGTELGGSPSQFFITLSNLKVNAPVVSQAITQSHQLFFRQKQMYE